MPSIHFTDISPIGKLRISGSSAHDFIRTMFTADVEKLEQLGGATASLLLTGEAEIIDTVIIIRTGDNEYMVTTHSQTVEEVFDWLTAHGKITDDEGAIFEGLEITNQTAALADVVLFGEGSRAVIDELSNGTFASAPHTGHITLVQLDTVTVLVFESPVLPGIGEVYELLCPPDGAEGLKYAFMSFPEIDPMPFDEYRALRIESKTWFEQADEASYIFPHDAGLLHLIRKESDFVGAKALRG
jgi:glycine cleavage system aminomethyltransferase T